MLLVRNDPAANHKGPFQSQILLETVHYGHTLDGSLQFGMPLAELLQYIGPFENGQQRLGETANKAQPSDTHMLSDEIAHCCLVDLQQQSQHILIKDGLGLLEALRDDVLRTLVRLLSSLVFRELRSEEGEHVRNGRSAEGSLEADVGEPSFVLHEVEELDCLVIDVGHVGMPTLRRKDVRSGSFSEGSGVEDAVAQASTRPHDTHCLFTLQIPLPDRYKLLFGYDQQAISIGLEVIDELEMRDIEFVAEEISLDEPPLGHIGHPERVVTDRPRNGQDSNFGLRNLAEELPQSSQKGGIVLNRVRLLLYHFLRVVVRRLDHNQLQSDVGPTDISKQRHCRFVQVLRTLMMVFVNQVAAYCCCRGYCSHSTHFKWIYFHKIIIKDIKEQQNHSLKS